MKRFTMVFAIALLLVALGAIPVFAQSSGSFSYGTANNGANANNTIGCVLLSNGSLNGGVQCAVSNVGTCPQGGLTPTTACAVGAAGDADCAGQFGTGSTCLPGDLCTIPCSPNGTTNATCTTDFGAGSVCINGTCSTSSCELFTCSRESDCTAIYGSNSGATCVGGFCELPTSPNGAKDCIGSATATLKTNSGSGNVFDIRPSAVIGLLTDVTITSKQAGAIASSSSLAGIDFTVSVTPANVGVPAPTLIPNGTITYDARFVEISTNLFAGITANCTSAVGGCFLTFAESTVSAHSFDWIAGQPGPKANGSLQSGEYTVTASWAPSVGFAVSGIGEAAACVGPVNLTVSQNKIFQFNGVNGL